MAPTTIQRVASVLRRLAYMPAPARSTIQLTLVSMIRDMRPGSRVQFSEATSVVPTSAFDEASEYTGRIVLRKGGSVDFVLRIQYAKEGEKDVYEAVWRRTDKPAPVAQVGANSLDQLLTRLVKVLDKNIPW